VSVHVCTEVKMLSYPGGNGCSASAVDWPAAAAEAAAEDAVAIVKYTQIYLATKNTEIIAHFNHFRNSFHPVYSNSLFYYHH